MRFARARSGVALVLALVIQSSGAQAADSTADYTVSFEAIWSSGTHPTNFPPNPHFSPLIGATHNASVVFWTPAGIASAGIESMAETGQTGLLTTEINAVLPGAADQVIAGSGINPSPGSTSVSFTAQQDFPLLTLVSMVAPSPDWFVGLDRFVLFDGANWVRQVSIDLFVYDAGTDNGVVFTSDDSNTSPQDPIGLLGGLPFDNGTPFGTYTITRTDAPAVTVLPGWALTTLVGLLAAAGIASRRLRPVLARPH